LNILNCVLCFLQIFLFIDTGTVLWGKSEHIKMCEVIWKLLGVQFLKFILHILWYQKWYFPLQIQKVWIWPGKYHFFFKVRCLDLPCTGLNPNNVKEIGLAFAFYLPVPRGKSKCLKNFFKILRPLEVLETKQNPEK